MSEENVKEPAKRSGSSAALWVIAIILGLMLICGLCTIMSMTSLGGVFWESFWQSFSQSMGG